MCKDFSTHWKSFLWYSHIVYKLDDKYQDKDGMIRVLLEKAAGVVGAKKGGFKKIQELVERLEKQDQNFDDKLKSSYLRQYGK